MVGRMFGAKIEDSLLDFRPAIERDTEEEQQPSIEAALAVFASAGVKRGDSNG